MQSFLIFMACAAVLNLLAPNVMANFVQLGFDDLINARCQSRCFLGLEKNHKNNSDARRQLRHQISEFCKDDQQCSSCVIPCREAIPKGKTCAENLCQRAASPANCRESCTFIEKISHQKPGTCPSQLQNHGNLECSAFCDSDSHCPETEKCCTTGCSRRCSPAQINDSRLLPIPEGITVHERKRKRSAILRWIMKRMTPQHLKTNSNLFVLQWRWSINKDLDSMSPWQTILVRNKMYAILKHLLVPSRYYTFRVASVNVHGTYGFSASSFPAFKLSKEVKAPSAPLNLTLLDIGNPMMDEEEEDGVLHPRVTWVAPESDIPLKDYQLSWWKTSPKFADAFERSHYVTFDRLESAKTDKRHAVASALRSNNADPVDPDEDYGLYTGVDGNAESHRNVIVPSYSTSAELDEVEPDEIYIVELFATVETSEGELRGEPAFLVVRPNQTTTSRWNSRSSESEQHNIEDLKKRPAESNELLDDPSASAENHSANFKAEVKTPYFENGRLRTSISWLNYPGCSDIVSNKLLFQAYIRSIRCLNELPPQQFTVRNCVATLENLQFSCDYFVQIEQVRPSRSIIIRTMFSTLPCERTPSEEPLQCVSRVPLWAMENLNVLKTTTENTTRTSEQRAEQDKPIANREAVQSSSTSSTTTARPSMQENKVVELRNKTNQLETDQREEPHLNCSRKTLDGIECLWNFPMTSSQTTRNPIIGYRILIGLVTGSSNVSIVGPTVKRINLRLLRKGTYRFRVQAITAHGLGTEVEKRFDMENVPGSTGTSSNQVATVTRQQIASNHMDRISLSTDRMGRSGVERISRHRTLQMIELIVYCFIFFPLIT